MTVPQPTRIRIEHMPCVFPHAAGLDIGSAEIVAALPPDGDSTVVRTFTTFTTDLHQLVTWLLEHRIDTVAMESTGVYWIPIYELLEAAAIRVYLVNAYHPIAAAEAFATAGSSPYPPSALARPLR